MGCSTRSLGQVDDTSQHQKTSRDVTAEPEPARQLQSSVTPGPVPEFAPLAQVISHVQADDLADKLNPTLTKLMRGNHVTAGHSWSGDSAAEPSDGSVVWMRDYQPIFVRQRDGALLALYYLSPSVNRSRHRLALPPSVTTEQLPLIHENGNLISMGRHVFFSEELFTDNAVSMDAPHLLDAGYRPRSEREVLRILSERLKRPIEDLIVMPRMPHEGTGHVDTYLLPLDTDVIAVPVIEKEGIALIDSGEPSYRIAQVTRTFLDEQASYLRTLGLTVLRMPMIPPARIQAPERAIIDDEVEIEHGSEDVLVFTPANTLLIHYGKHRFAVLPSFSRISDDPATIALAARYQERWARMLRGLGWTPHFVDASELVGYFGLIRCLSASIPR